MSLPAPPSKTTGIERRAADASSVKLSSSAPPVIVRLVTSASGRLEATPSMLTIRSPSLTETETELAAGPSWTSQLRLSSLSAAGGDGPLPGTAAGSRDGKEASAGAAPALDESASTVSAPMEPDRSSGVPLPPVPVADDAVSACVPPPSLSSAGVAVATTSGATPADVSDALRETSVLVEDAVGSELVESDAAGSAAAGASCSPLDEVSVTAVASRVAESSVETEDTSEELGAAIEPPFPGAPIESVLPVGAVCAASTSGPAA